MDGSPRHATPTRSSAWAVCRTPATCGGATALSTRPASPGIRPRPSDPKRLTPRSQRAAKGRDDGTAIFAALCELRVKIPSLLAKNTRAGVVHTAVAAAIAELAAFAGHV